MKSEVIRIEVHQTAKVFAIVAAILSAFISVFSLIALAFGIETSVSFNYIISITVSGAVWKTVLLLIYPILTYIFVYFSVAVLCLVYNFTAKNFGGMKFRSRQAQYH